MSATFAILLERFFTQRLMTQRNASPHTIASYRDTFRMLLQFTRQHLNKAPSSLELTDIDATLITTFLSELENKREISARSRNLRLTAIRSFFRYAALEAPAQSAQIQRVLAIPCKRHTKTQVDFLTRPEVEALLATPDQRKWSGRRDHALILVAVHTGLRLSELTGLTWSQLVLGTGAHIRVIGKGRKERCTPLTKQSVAVLKSWMREQEPVGCQSVFPNARGGKLSSDGMQYILNKHTSAASSVCPSLLDKRVTPHLLRHTMAMGLLEAGIDRSIIALWLGHESVETTQIYLHANLDLKQKILDKIQMPEGKPGRYRPDDKLLSFLSSL